MSKPEPPPACEGDPVTIKLIDWINQNQIPSKTKPSFGRKQASAAIKLIEERDEYGFKKYGQHLMTKDGRNTIEDARQEFGDLLQYIYKAKLNGEDIEPIRELFPVLKKLLFSTE